MFLSLSCTPDDVGDIQTMPLSFISRAVHIPGSGLSEGTGVNAAGAGGAAGPAAAPGQQDETTSMATFSNSSTT